MSQDNAPERGWIPGIIKILGTSALRDMDSADIMWQGVLVSFTETEKSRLTDNLARVTKSIFNPFTKNIGNAWYEAEKY